MAEDKSKKELLIFLGLTMGIQFSSWWVARLLILNPGKKVPPELFMAIGALGPSWLAVVLALAGPKGAFRGLIRSMFRWRVGLRWWLVAFLTFPFVNLVFDLFLRIIGQYQGPLDLARYYRVMPVLLLSGFIFKDSGPLGEEFGWRGYALPRMLRLMSPLSSALLLGLIWALWHLPAWWIPGGEFRTMNFWVFTSAVLGISVSMTFTYIHAKHSALVGGIVWHMMTNVCSPFNARIAKSTERIMVAYLVIAVAFVILDYRNMLGKRVNNDGVREATKVTEAGA